jgi:catechol 2,3-dioxygenase-like lactoylglutathione lyase family enzyme
MAVFMGSVVLNVSNSTRAAAFWSQALGYVAHPGNPEFLVPPEWQPPSDFRRDHGDGMHLHLDRDDKTHLDLWVERNSSLQAEVERLVSQGARRVDWSYPKDADHVVLADPEGNLFCVCE